MKKAHIVSIVFVLVYLAIHLYGLTALPIFADEAIYIRWSQLILDDWKQYLFFPLNDGKTPLLIWLQVPLLRVFADQLFAARLLSVGVGLAQAAVLYRFTLSVGGKRVAAWISAAFVAVLPYWFFHHRIALIDGMLTLWLSCTVWMIWQALSSLRKHKLEGLSLPLIKRIVSDRTLVAYASIAGMSFAAALWTKLPAVLLIPPMVLLALISGRGWIQKLYQVGLVAAIIGAGYAVFFTQAFHPAFPQLFSRGSDFLFSSSQLFAGEVLQHTLPSVPNYAWYFIAYATAPFWILLLLGLFYGEHKPKVHLLFWLGVAFIAPMMILGRVVYPRYLLPGMLFFTPAAALAIEGLLTGIQRRKLKPVTLLLAVSVTVLVANISNYSVRFMLPAILEPNTIPFVSADREQYLLEWSSGHGIQETAALITAAAGQERIAVATEGYFGTLPDALLVYFHNRQVDNIYIEGIGQPVQEIPQSFMQKSQDADQRWLVVNSHRLHIEQPGTLLAEFCRPLAAPCLQVWRLSD